MNTTGFSCPWDSGQIGWIYASLEDVKKEFGDDSPSSIEKALSSCEPKQSFMTIICVGNAMVPSLRKR
jgi:hypothetical protein